MEHENLSIGKPGLYKTKNGVRVVFPPIEYEMSPRNHQWCLDKLEEARKNIQTPSGS